MVTENVTYSHTWQLYMRLKILIEGVGGQNQPTPNYCGISYGVKNIRDKYSMYLNRLPRESFPRDTVTKLFSQVVSCPVTPPVLVQ